MPTRPSRSTPSAPRTVRMAETILALIDAGSRAVPKNKILRGEVGHEREMTIPGMSAKAGIEDALPLGALITDLVTDDGHIDIDPPHQDAGTEVRLDEVMARSSRALGAGAHLVETPSDLIQLGTGPDTMLASRRVQFGTFEAARFSVVDFDADPNAEVSVTDPPFHNAELDRDAMVSRALAFKLTRRQLKEKSNARLASELSWSITQGMGRAVDATLFDAINALSANNWALGKAAANGVPFSNLKAMVGTSALGAVPIEGDLYVEGIPATLSPDMEQTIVGLWSRAAVVIDPDVRIQIARLGSNGALEVTVWLSLQALLPDPSMFWHVQ